MKNEYWMNVFKKELDFSPNCLNILLEHSK